MKTADILKLSKHQLNSMRKYDPKTLRKYVQQAASAANKRLDRLAKSGYAAASIEWGIINGQTGSGRLGRGRFSTKGKNPTQLRHEIDRIRRFMEAETSTIKGIMNVMHRTEERLSNVLGRTFKFKSPKDYQEYWNFVDEYEKQYAHVIANLSSNRIQALVLDQFDKGNRDNLELVEANRIEDNRKRFAKPF